MDITSFKNRNNNEQPTVKIPLYKKLCRQKWFKILKPFLIVGIIILTIYILTIIGIFQIKKIEHPKNLQYVTNWEQATNSYLGQGYFSLDLENLREDIRNINGYVKDITAEKIFPNKILLYITEHIPQYYWEYKEECKIFSTEGILLNSSNEYEKCEVEKGIKIMSNDNILADNHLIYDTEIPQLITILEEFSWDIQSITIEKSILTIKGENTTVIIECSDGFDEQIAKLYLVLEKANIDSIQYKSIDMRFERPVMEIE